MIQIATEGGGQHAKPGLATATETQTPRRVTTDESYTGTSG